MQKNSTIIYSQNNNKLIDQNEIHENNVAVVVTIIITAIDAAKCSLILYDAKPKHEMKFQLQQNETIFVQSKLFLMPGNSLRVKSDKSNTTFTAMYDISENS